VTAHVEETAHHVIVAPDDDHRLTVGQITREVLAWPFNLIETTGKLPRAGKNGSTLEVKNSLIEVPVGRDSRRLRKGVVALVAVDDLDELRGQSVH
jgi:hypothetical protein